jgi:hypothetical protein
MSGAVFFEFSNLPAFEFEFAARCAAGPPPANFGRQVIAASGRESDRRVCEGVQAAGVVSRGPTHDLLAAAGAALATRRASPLSRARPLRSPRMALYSKGGLRLRAGRFHEARIASEGRL